MKIYKKLLSDILEHGSDKGDRTGTGTRSLFGYQMRFDLSKGFPLVTTKKMFWKGIVHELIWLISGSTNIKYLTDNGVHIWDEWADEDGDLGPVYGAQWRRYLGFGKDKFDEETQCWKGHPVWTDQLQILVDQIKMNPNSRRHIVTAWNPTDLPDQKLPPCHMMFQFYVANNKLSCQMYQRSMDSALGCPFNIASYALLTHIIANICDLEIGDFVHTIGDAHIYNNHVEAIGEQLKRDPFPLPALKINRKLTSIDDLKFEDFTLENYKHHPAIKMEVSV